MSLVSKVKELLGVKAEQHEAPKGNIKVKTVDLPIIPRSQDEHLYTEMIYHANDFILILVSYSPEYYFAMAEFCSACSLSEVKIKVAKSSDEVKDENDNPAVKIYDYALISCTYMTLTQLYKTIDNLANEILEAITVDIYANCNHEQLSDLINDGILEETRFESFVNEPIYTHTCWTGEYHVDYGSYIDDLGEESKNIDRYKVYLPNTIDIMNKIPNCFTFIDLLPLILCTSYVIKYNNTKEFWEIVSLKDTLYCWYHNKYIFEREIDAYETIFEPILHQQHKDYDFYMNLIRPRYLISEDDEDTESSYMSNEEIDTMFKEKYDRFNATDAVQYKDLDEEIEIPEDEE